MIKFVWMLGLAAQLSAAPVTLTAVWQPNTEPDLAGYVVRYGSAPGEYTHEVDVDMDTTLSIDWDDMSPCYAVVLAYDYSQNMSQPSVEAMWSPASRFDLNDDGIVDIDDGILLESYLGATVNSFNWDPRFDLNNDGIIDIDDEILLEHHYGERL